MAANENLSLWRELKWLFGLIDLPSPLLKFLDAYQTHELSVSTAKFILEESEKLLASIIETGNILTNRAIGLLQIQIPILIATVGYAGYCFEKELYSPLMMVTVSYAASTFSSAIMTFRVFWTAKTQSVGGRPMLLAEKSLYDFDNANHEVLILMNQIQVYDRNIRYNLVRNKRRAFWFKQSVLALLSGIVIAVGYLFVP